MVKKSRSVLKSQRRAEKRRLLNKSKRTRLKTEIKKFMQAKNKKEIFPSLQSLIDRLAQQHIIHHNKAARLKSRLQRLIEGS